MQVRYPQADVPTYQVSIRSGYDPQVHLALAPLREAGVVIAGSGLGYHKLRRMGEAGRAPSVAFDAWLETAVNAEPPQRVALLKEWDKRPRRASATRAMSRAASCFQLSFRMNRRRK